MVLLKVKALFCGFRLYFPCSEFKVFQRMCVFVLWFHGEFSFCFQSSVRCVCISLFISLFNCLMWGSLGFALRVWLRVFILLRILVGSGMWCLLSLPFGMYILSAWRMVAVRNLFAWCMLCVGGALSSAFSMCRVKDVQSALL